MDGSVTGLTCRSEQVRRYLQPIVGAKIAEVCARALVDGRLWLLDARRWLRFGSHSWEPRGQVPTYHGYYPDSMQGTPKVRGLYQRWIRGNKVNNNGDASRFIGLWLNLQQILKEGIEGDFAELGVWRGNSAAVLAEFAEQSGRHLFLLDTFSGFDERNLVGIDEEKHILFTEKYNLFTDTSIAYAKETVQRANETTYIKGFFPESVTEELAARTFAVAHIDCDLYEPMKAALEFFYPRMPRGGMLILHDYSSGSWAGATKAIDDFCAASGERVTLWPDKSGTAVIRKVR